MLNDKLKGAIAGALTVAVIGCSTGLAKEASESITAVYQNIKLVVDGVLIEPKDANGNAVEPFIYNGTTYLPVRSVAQAFGKEVSWDGENATVFLGGEVDKPAKELPLWNRAYIECDSPNRISSYEEKGIGYIKYDPSNGGEELSGNRLLRGASVTYPLNALAKTISGEFYITGGTASEGVLKIYNSSGKQIYESPIMRKSTAPVKFNVNVEKEISVQLYFEITSADYYDSHADMYIKNPTITSSDY